MGDAHDHTSRGRAAQPGRARDSDGQLHAGILGPRGAVLRVDRQWAADAAHVVGRAADRISRSRRPGRCARPSLPTPLRLPVLRPQRQGRAALRLPRLDVRRRRQLSRHAERSQAPGVSQQDHRQGLSGRGAQRSDLDLHGRAQGAAAAADVRIGHDRRRQRAQSVHGAARMQLSAGARRRHRYLPSRLPAHGRGRGRGYRARPSRALCARQPRA